eukprot:SAG31_NODE_1641_length_7664_cov_3.789954_1_plen_208_part_00
MPSSGSNGHNPSNGKPGSHIKVEPTTFGAAARWADQCQQKGQQSCGLLHGGPFSDPFPGHRRKWRPPGSDARQASLRKDSDAAGGNASKRRQDGFMVSGVLGTDQFAEHSAPPPRWRRPTVCRPMGKPLAHYPALLQRIVEAIEARGKSRNGRITIRDLRPLADGVRDFNLPILFPACAHLSVQCSREAFTNGTSRSSACSAWMRFL